MNWRRWALLGWALLAILLTYGVLRAIGTDGKLRELRVENATLTADSKRQAQAVRDAAAAVVAADSAARVADTEAIARVEAANRRAASAAASFRVRLDSPAMVAAFDSVQAAHAEELEAVRDQARRQDVLRLAQIRARDAMIERQQERLGTQDRLVTNLREQVSRLDPPFFAGLLRGLPKTLATVGGAYAGAKLWTDDPGVGAAIGAGLAQVFVN